MISFFLFAPYGAYRLKLCTQENRVYNDNWFDLKSSHGLPLVSSLIAR